MPKALRLPIRLLTIGYEGVSVQGFVQTLVRARVTQLVDVRELPLSRREGFSKNALSENLTSARIGYQHARALGAPRHIRHRLREDGDLPSYFADFGDYLATQRAALDELAQKMSGAVVLLCYERNPAECHRSLVAAALARRLKTSVEHLSVPLNDTQQALRRSRLHSRRGVSTSK